jgi:hypothetical protein
VSCSAPLATDQRYCLECGERRLPMSSILAGGTPTGASASGASAQARSTPAAPPAGSRPPQGPFVDGAAQRNNALTVIAGVGVLLLAMGVGVLIGRSGSSGQSNAPAQVISVASTPAAGIATTAAAEASFSGDWPAGTSGYTVQLQTLPQAGTTVAAVEAAKSAAAAKGAKAVGALKAEEFASLTGGGYVIYSGVDHKRAQAQADLSGLKKSFPAARVIAVTNKGAGGSAGSGSGSTSGAAGSSESHPAPPSVLNNLKSAKGKSYEEKSKALPDVVETG